MPLRRVVGLVTAQSAENPPSSPVQGGMTAADRTKRVLVWCGSGVVTAAVTAALILFGTPMGVRIALGIPFMLAAPGYALERALFPARSGNWPQLTATVLGLSLIATILVTLALNLSPWGLSSATWAVGIGSVTVTAAVVAAHRVPAAATRRRPWDVGLLALAGLVAAAAMVLAFHPLGPPPSAHGYTELWLVHYRKTVQLGVVSYERQRTSYLVQVLNGRELEYRDLIVLDPGQRWVTSLPPNPKVLDARLWLRPGTSKPVLYREVQLAPGSQR